MREKGCPYVYQTAEPIRIAAFAGFRMCDENVTYAASPRRRPITRADFGHNDLVSWFANEKGFWRLASSVNSQRPNAMAFQEKLFGTILPQIQRNGYYEERRYMVGEEPSGDESASEETSEQTAPGPASEETSAILQGWPVYKLDAGLRDYTRVDRSPWGDVSRGDWHGDWCIFPHQSPQSAGNLEFILPMRPFDLGTAHVVQFG